MGRKIPGKKHKGIKDPLKQQHERHEKLKLVINAPPSDPNMQELPKSVLEMNRLRELAKNGNFKAKKKKKRKSMDSKGLISYAGPKLPGMNQEDITFPRLKQRLGESDDSFLRRMETATSQALSEAVLEAKHDLVVNRSSSGVITDVKPKPKSSLEEPPRKMKNSSKKNQGPLVSAKDKLSHLKEKKLKKKLKRINVKEDDFEKKVDIVKFGEVAHQPPQLKKRPRGCDSSSADRPGKKSSLLLTKLLTPGSEGQSMAHRKQVASAREEAMRVYKEMKARNWQAQRRN